MRFETELTKRARGTGRYFARAKSKALRIVLLVTALCSIESTGIGATVAQDSATPIASDVQVTDVTVGEESFLVVRFGVEIDSNGLLSRSDNAMSKLSATLDSVLAPFMQCEIVLGIISAGGNEAEAYDVGSMIAEVLYLDFADLSAQATFGRLSLNEPSRSDFAELTLYFEDGCVPSTDAATPTATGLNQTGTRSR